MPRTVWLTSDEPCCADCAQRLLSYLVNRSSCWLVASALSACGGAATAPTSVPANTQQAAPANEALRLDWDELGWAFEIPMLPAISADGTVIVIAKSEPLR